MNEICDLEKNALVKKTRIKKNPEVSIIDNMEEISEKALEKSIDQRERLLALNKAELKFQ